MIKINFKDYFRHRVWFGWYWTGVLGISDPYWCRLRTDDRWAVGKDARGFRAW